MLLKTFATPFFALKLQVLVENQPTAGENTDTYVTAVLSFGAVNNICLLIRTWPAAEWPS